MWNLPLTKSDHKGQFGPKIGLNAWNGVRWVNMTWYFFYWCKILPWISYSKILHPKIGLNAPSSRVYNNAIAYIFIDFLPIMHHMQSFARRLWIRRIVIIMERGLIVHVFFQSWLLNPFSSCLNNRCTDKHVIFKRRTFRRSRLERRICITLLYTHFTTSWHFRCFVCNFLSFFGG